MEDGGGSRTLIDGEGRLFGYANVIDVLVVLLVVAVGIAGVTLVLSSTGSPETDSTHVTIDLGVQPSSVATAISPRDTVQSSPDSTLTVTDVYRVPEGDGYRTFVRVNVTGPPSESDAMFGNVRPILGQNMTVQTDRYNATGDITAVGSGASIGLSEQTVVLNMALPSYRSETFRTGQQIRLSDNRIATIEDIARYDASGSDRIQLFIEASLRVRTVDDIPRFGGTLVQEGATIQLPGDQSIVTATVQRVGGFDRSTTNVLVSDTLTDSEARDLSSGDVYTVSGRTVATVNSVSVYDTEQPDRKQVFANLTLQTVAGANDPRFGSTVVRQGATVPFRTDAYELEGQIERVNQNIQQSSTEVLVYDTINADYAADIVAGDQYVVAGRSIATVKSVTTYSTTDPGQREVYLGLSLETLNYGELPQFGSTAVRRGTTVPFRTDAYDIDGRVERVGTTELAGTPSRKTARIEISNISPSLATSIETGLTERSGGETIARILSVQRENATVVLTSDDGQIYQREHPVNKDVTVTAELLLRETTAGLQFRGQLIRQGQTIRLDLGAISVEGELIGPLRDT